MRVVGVDQSYTGFGFCVDGESKKRSFPPGRYDSDVHRLVAIRNWYQDWLSLQMKAGLDLVVMEGYANAAKFGREVAGELGGVVKIATLEVVGHPPLIVPPTSLKKFVSGSGGAKKNTMLAHVYKKWGVLFSDDNQADAYALEKFGAVYLNTRDGRNTNSYLKYEIEAVEAVRKAK
jgi:hypothetical protein